MNITSGHRWYEIDKMFKERVKNFNWTIYKPKKVDQNARLNDIKDDP
jgi:hypothetical protein